MVNQTKWKPLGYWVLFIFVLSLIPLYVYFDKLGSWHLSENLHDWADFGVYVGGVLGPWLAFANIIVLLRLTYIVAKLDENNSRSSLESQKMLSLNQLRQTAYKQIADRLYSLHALVLDWTNIGRQLMLLQMDLVSFNNTMRHLFEGLSDAAKREPIEKSLYQVIIKLNGLREAAPEARDASIDAIEAAYSDFVTTRDLYLQMLQDHMLETPTDRGGYGN
jgi:hypothetical protein